MKRVIVLLTIALLVLTACGSNDNSGSSSVLPSADYCEADSDCVCGGTDKKTDRCFLGNKEYYAKNVNKGKDCPDFCGGIDGRLSVRCVDNKCTQMYGCIDEFDCSEGQKCVKNRCVGTVDGECEADKDCMKGGCSSTVCQSKNEEPIFTTCEFKDEYECYGQIDCGCVDGNCMWKETADFRNCVAEKQS